MKLPISMAAMPAVILVLALISIVRGRINLMAYVVLTIMCFLSGMHGRLTAILLRPDTELLHSGNLLAALVVNSLLVVYLAVVAVLHFFPNLGEIPVVTLREKSIWRFIEVNGFAIMCGVGMHWLVYR